MLRVGEEGQSCSFSVILAKDSHTTSYSFSAILVIWLKAVTQLSTILVMESPCFNTALLENNLT